MSTEQLLICGILLLTVGFFLWGRWRHDMVAAGALFACVATGLVAAEDAFSGFGHPAVVTVACVLILSHALQNSGAIDLVIRRTIPTDSGPTLTIAALTGVAAVLSGFMNNVGALALLMPVAMQIAGRQGIPPGQVLMPLAFGSILGGMTTLIGTPPNLIVSGFRADAGMGAFRMFDFTPVGITVAAVGVLFVALLGWRLVPARERAGAEGFETEAYITEVRVTEKSKAAGLRVREIERKLEEDDAQIIGLVRGEERVTAPDSRGLVRADDILVIEAEAESLSQALASLGLELEEATNGDESADVAEDQSEALAKEQDVADDDSKEDEDEDSKAEEDDVVLLELAILPRSPLVGRTPTEAQIRTRYGINLLALSRRGSRSLTRLRTTRLDAGDVLLMQGTNTTVMEFANDFGCVPLAERDVRVPDGRKALTATGIMLTAVATAALGLLPAAVAFLGGVLASMVFRTVQWRSVYEAVDWPVVVLLAALIPVAGAMESTGAAELIATGLLEGIAQGHPIIALGLILIVTMTLSDLINNAATAAVMCPIAISTASALDASPDPFLMAVAIGASCAFLTPIGHQNNTLILGPGGFRFGDYWRLGLPVELIVIGVSIPMLLLIWPL